MAEGGIKAVSTDRMEAEYIGILCAIPCLPRKPKPKRRIGECQAINRRLNPCHPSLSISSYHVIPLHLSPSIVRQQIISIICPVSCPSHLLPHASTYSNLNSPNGPTPELKESLTVPGGNCSPTLPSAGNIWAIWLLSPCPPNSSKSSPWKP